MARQSFLWTALPNGYGAEGTALRLSVMLSPRLDPLAGLQTLSAFFPDWEDWPQTLSQATFDISYGGTTVSVAANATSGLHHVDSRLGVADSAVWKALFTGALRVQGFAFTDLSRTSVLSYDTVAMKGIVEHLYRELARTAVDRMPLVSEVIESEGWRGLVGAVQELDASSMDQHTGLRDPRIQFARHARQQRGAMQPSTVTSSASAAQTLERFQLFHTPPATPIARHEPRKDDARIDAKWLEYQRTELPQREDIAKQLDFHQIVAAMGSYPTLLRRLGLVVDLLLTPAAFPAAASADLSVKVVFPPGLLKVMRTSDAGPITRARLTSTQFDAVSDPAADLRIKDRLLELDPARFHLLQLDVDGAGLKVMNFARSLGRRFNVEARVHPVTRHEDEIGAPALRTAGLMLVQKQRGTALSHRFDLNKTRNASIEGQFAGAVNNLALHAEDLVRGYRIDIWDSMTGRWRSLCRRNARYELSDGLVVVEPTAEEESTVRLAATRSSDKSSNPDLLYLHEALVSWTGWSLAAPPPGRSVQPDDSVDKTHIQSEAEVPPGLKFVSRFSPVKGSLPRLRYGRSYWIRARSVDLAGNSLDPQDDDFGAERPFTYAQRYLRYEPVGAPIIALLSSADTIERPAEGESMARIAIRSFNDSPALNTMASPQIAHRVAAPPQVSVRDAEQHGVLETGGAMDGSLFNLLANRKDVDARSSAAAIRHVTIPMQGPLDVGAVETTFAVYDAGRALTYLPDPMAFEVSARIFNHPNIASSEIITVPLYSEGNWPEAQPFIIEVYDDPLQAPYFDAATRKLRVPLPKAVVATIRLSMALTPDGLRKMGVFALMNVADMDAQLDRALAGQHWMLTPWMVVEVVHAMQRPLVTPEFTVLTVHDRDLGQTSARPLILTTCSIDSTDRLDLLGEWHEPLDDATAPDSKTGPADRQRRDVAFQVKVTGPAHYADATKGFKAGGFPDHAIAGPDLIGINTAGDSLPVKAHEFHDTRYRRIEYWFDATTRFREFMPGQLLTANENGTRVPVETNIKVTGARKAAWVPSSAPPPAPNVLYVIPTFGWARDVDDHGTLSSWRRGGGLRVYLDRGWNASGYGEMLGVVLPPTAFSGDPDDTPTSAPYKKYVTQWGNDPIWESAFVSGIAPGRDDFPLARTAPDATGAWLPPNAPDSEKDQRPGPFLVKGLNPPGLFRYSSPSKKRLRPSLERGAGEVDVAPHDVFYDVNRNLWYCDIEIRTGASYYPFIRLALARYQPTSSADAHLSNVVLADIMALTADRWLNVTPAADARRMRVAVFGVSYSESSAHYEVAHAPALSLIDPLTGHVDNLVPAKVSETNIVEVWIERLDTRWGEDFGWSRVSDVVISQRIPATSGSAPSPSVSIELVFGRAISAGERIKTRELVTSKDVVRITPSSVVDLIHEWQTLWEGDITLPTAESDAARRRLVVAEYEEYLVDDDRPYGKTPTRSKRRLVFVEHIELS